MFPNIQTLPHFQRIQQFYSCCEAEQILLKRQNTYLVLSEFTLNYQNLCQDLFQSRQKFCGKIAVHSCFWGRSNEQNFIELLFVVQEQYHFYWRCWMFKTSFIDITGVHPTGTNCELTSLLRCFRASMLRYAEKISWGMAQWRWISAQ